MLLFRFERLADFLDTLRRLWSILVLRCNLVCGRCNLDTLDEEYAFVVVPPRFLKHPTEARYRVWQIDRSLPFSRLGVVGALIAWFTAAASTVVLPAADHSNTLFWTFYVIVPILGASLASTYWPPTRPFVPLLMATANAISGVASTWLCFNFADPRPDLALALLITTTFFGFTIFRLNPYLAVLAALTYATLFVWLLWTNADIPYAHQVTYVVLTANAIIIGLIACLVIDAIDRTNFRQEAIIKQQQQVIAREQERTGVLLRNALPAGIAARLLASDGVIADQFNSTTVLFADIVGFTPLASTMTPGDVVDLLNGIFSRFDTLLLKFGAEKIKTIGDAYMAVVGAPEPHRDHAGSAADLALAMQQCITQHNASSGRALHLRIGLSSGPVVAGVIGTSRVAYDLWGDTVNTASRMESHGVADAIQVSEETHRLLVGRYSFEERDPIDVKGKGLMRTFLLVSAST